MGQIIKYYSPEIYMGLKSFIAGGQFIGEDGELGEVELKGSLVEDVKGLDCSFWYLWDVSSYVNGNFIRTRTMSLTIEGIKNFDGGIYGLKYELKRVIEDESNY